MRSCTTATSTHRIAATTPKPCEKVSDSLNDLEEKLTEQLAGENKALFLRFCNVYAEFMGESELDTFITGFRLGARFMMDTFLSDDAPFESFLSG